MILGNFALEAPETEHAPMHQRHHQYQHDVGVSATIVFNIRRVSGILDIAQFLRILLWFVMGSE